MSDFFDDLRTEPDAGHFDGPLGDLSRALETATDAYVKACNKSADDENAYLRAFHRCWAQSLDVAVTARSKHVDAQEEPTDAKCAWNLSAAAEKAAKAKVGELHDRLIAAMSWQRMVGAQT